MVKKGKIMNEKLKHFQKVFDEIKYLYGVEIKINSQFYHDKTGFYYQNCDIKTLTSFFFKVFQLKLTPLTISSTKDFFYFGKQPNQKS